jgi:group I intron endonuclease
MYGIIYKTTNLVNGKTYVGQRKIKDWRCLDKYYKGSGIRIKLAIKKYGLKSFDREILSYVDSLEQANRLETLYIKMLCPDYNLRSGGGQGGSLSEESKIKISNSNKGKRYNPNGSKGFHWYTDGITEEYSMKCPDGFRLGRYNSAWHRNKLL